MVTNVLPYSVLLANAQHQNISNAAFFVISSLY